MILYEAMMSCGQMLACIALCFCEHIAHSLCTVNLDCVKNALVEDPTCFKLEDTYTLLTEGNSLSIAAIMGAWQSFMHTILLRKEVCVFGAVL
ncbi:hypothetical protein EON65_02315 [archaeon]|nr:MAG: hypothetical protein EON65_02315 [archaeon]